MILMELSVILEKEQGGNSATECSFFSDSTNCTNNGCIWDGSCQDPANCTDIGDNQGRCENYSYDLYGFFCAFPGGQEEGGPCEDADECKDFYREGPCLDADNSVGENCTWDPERRCCGITGCNGDGESTSDGDDDDSGVIIGTTSSEDTSVSCFLSINGSYPDLEDLEGTYIAGDNFNDHLTYSYNGYYIFWDAESEEWDLSNEVDEDEIIYSETGELIGDWIYEPEDDCSNGVDDDEDGDVDCNDSDCSSDENCIYINDLSSPPTEGNYTAFNVPLNCANGNCASGNFYIYAIDTSDDSIYGYLSPPSVGGSTIGSLYIPESAAGTTFLFNAAWGSPDGSYPGSPFELGDFYYEQLARRRYNSKLDNFSRSNRNNRLSYNNFKRG